MSVGGQMRIFDWLTPKDNWLKETLAYHERANRHQNALEPNNFLHYAEQRSQALSVIEHEVAQPTAQEKRIANINHGLSAVVEYIDKRKRKTKHGQFIKDSRYPFAASARSEETAADSGS